MYKKLVAEGQMVSELDVLIAGIATANDETLVMRDKDFRAKEHKTILV